MNSELCWVIRRLERGERDKFFREFGEVLVHLSLLLRSLEIILHWQSWCWPEWYYFWSVWLELKDKKRPLLRPQLLQLKHRVSLVQFWKTYILSLGLISECLKQLSGESGIFISDNFPDDYGTDTDCTWNITVAEDKRVKLTFHLFNVIFIWFIIPF